MTMTAKELARQLKYIADLKDLGIDWRPPTSEEIACVHKWRGPYKERTCTKCGGKQTN